MMTERDWSGVFRSLRTLDVCNVAVRIKSWLNDLEEHESRSLRVEALLNEFGVSDYINNPVSPRLQQYVKTLMRSRMRWFERWCAEHKAAESLREHAEILQGQVAVLQAKLRLVRTDAPNVWQWDGDAKGLEGLTAPVVMPAEALRQLLQEKQAVEEKLQELRAQSASIARQLAGIAR